jgi:hypothetical protein
MTPYSNETINPPPSGVDAQTVPPRIREPINPAEPMRGTSYDRTLPGRAVAMVGRRVHQAGETERVLGLGLRGEATLFVAVVVDAPQAATWLQRPVRRLKKRDAQRRADRTNRPPSPHRPQVDLARTASRWRSDRLGLTHLSVGDPAVAGSVHGTMPS